MVHDYKLKIKLSELINSGDIDTAIDLIKNNKLERLPASGFHWFRNGLESTLPNTNWLFFLEKFLFSNLTPDIIETQAFFKEKSIDYAIDNENYDIILILMQNFPVLEQENLITKILQNSIADKLVINLLTRITNMDLKSIVYDCAVRISYAEHDIVLLKELYSMHNQRELNFTKLSSSFNKLIWNKILSLNNEQVSFMHTIINKFKSFATFDYTCAQLMIAERKCRKNYIYDPTILRYFQTDNQFNFDEFEIYLQIIKNMHRPVTERFILAGPHWFCGVINITTDNIAKVYFIDSLGTKDKQIYPPVQTAIAIFNEIFSENIIYLSAEKRQNSYQGCSVFALDDMAHLYRLKLEKKYKENNLWEYLQEAEKDKNSHIITINNNNKTINIKACKIPLTFTRTMQSESLLTAIIPARSAEEQQAIINKKNETAKISALKFFVLDKLSNKSQNHRLRYKLNKMKDHAFNFMLNYSKEYIEHLIFNASLSGFKEKNNPQELQIDPNSMFH